MIVNNFNMRSSYTKWNPKSKDKCPYKRRKGEITQRTRQCKTEIQTGVVSISQERSRIAGKMLGEKYRMDSPSEAVEGTNPIYTLIL